MLLLLLLTIVTQGAAATPLLSVYHAVAVDYEAGHRERALRDIRRWRPGEVRAVARALREEGNRRERLLLPTGEELAEVPVEIDVRAVEAAALLHVEAGLLELQSLRAGSAESHLSAAASLVDWSHELQTDRLEERRDVLARVRRRLGPSGALEPAVSDELDRAFSIELTIDRAGFYLALAAGTLGVGFPEVALPFAETAKAAAPLDGDVLLVVACVKETLASAEEARTHEEDARRLRAEAEALFRETLVVDPNRVEAQLRLGRVLITQGRTREGEPLLRRAVEQARDDRQRYLGLLFLGRASEQLVGPDEGVAAYRRALEVWPDSQAARLALGRCLEATAGPPAARSLVRASLLESRNPTREPDPWWSYPSGPRELAKVAVERLWQATLARSFGS